MICKTIYEFLMWDNCNNNCKFCFQRENPRIFSIKEQEDICESIIEYLNSDRFIPGNHVLIVGGEIFDNLGRRIFLPKFFDQITDMMTTDKIDLLYLNTNLLYPESCISFLHEILDIFVRKGIVDRLKFTTSYDLSGRFKSKHHEDLFLQNLRQLSKIKGLNTVTNIILTKQVCQSILEDKFDIFRFSKENNTNINLIPYIILDENLAPERCEVFECLKKLDKVNPEYIKSFIFEQDLKQPRILLQCSKDKSFLQKTCQNSDCGHSVNFKRYSKSGSCFVCDVKSLFSKYY